MRFHGRCCSWPAVLLSCALALGVGDGRALAVDAGFQKTVQPFLRANCLGCHNDQLKTAKLSLQLAKPDAADLALWESVSQKISTGLMPPPGTTHPPEASRKAVLEWIEAEMARLAQHAKPDPGRVTARRLNRAEYNNTVRDLLGVDFRPADGFPADDSGYGFDNIGDVLSVSPSLMDHYMRAAEKIAASAIDLSPAPRPTLERYISDRNEQIRRVRPDDPKGYPYPPGAFEARHTFDVEADYDLVLKVHDHREGDWAKAAPFVHFYFDGKKIGSWKIEQGEYVQGIFVVRRHVTAGAHTLYAEFDQDYVDIEPPFQGDKTYRETRRLIVDLFDINGPFQYNPRATASYKNIFICPDETDECAAKIVSHLARRAFRRTVKPEDVAKYMRLVSLARSNGDSFEAGIQLALKAVLVSPHFLFRVERDPDPADPLRIHRVSDLELASRLSFFLWSSMPDDELLDLAERGKLSHPDVLKAQVRRMLASPKSQALVRNFAGQWLQIRNLDKVAPDPDRFPMFDPYLREAMLRETELFFEYVQRQDRSILDFIDSSYTFLNNRLAKFYGIEGVHGHEFRRVDLDSNQRGGVITQASVLTVSSYPTRTSPVLRGLWVLENLLGAPPPPPPAGTPRLDERKIGLDLPLRKQLEQHRAAPSCAVCHVRMDAIGFGLENFDAVGAWRTQDGKFLVDAAGALPGGKAFHHPAELRKILMEDKEAFARTLSEKMLTYAIGRGLERYDRPAVYSIARAVAADGYRFSRLILEVINSTPFQMRRGEGGRS